MRKIFLILLVVMLSVQVTALAKDKGLSAEERIKVAVEVSDTSRHKELGTAQILELFLSSELVKKNLLNVVDTTPIDEAFDDNLIRDEEVTADSKSSLDNLGELLVFDAVELPASNETIKDFDATFYSAAGASYVIRCEVLALGLTKVEDKTLSMISGATGGIISLIGSGNKSRDKTLRRIGTGIGFGGFIVTDRTALNTVVNMQFIDVATGKVVWQEHFVGQAVKHHKPSKDYDDVWTQAYSESVEDTARRIAKRVNKYVDKVIIKGKSDKSFMPKGISIGSTLIGSKIF